MPIIKKPTKKDFSKSTIRPSLLATLRFQDKFGSLLDEGFVWDAIQWAFKDHSTLEVTRVEVQPDYNQSSINEA